MMFISVYIQWGTDGRTDGRTHIVIMVQTHGSCNMLSMVRDMWQRVCEAC